MRKFRFLCIVLMLIASSCNKDEVITVTYEDHYRAKTPSSSADWSKVFEYTPAPGQFIGDEQLGGFTGSEITPASAIAYAERRLGDGLFVSLGGFGGYLVVGFDHSIDNVAGYDLAIQGNSFDGSSEPGIVWVMQDENGDGLPNDRWYELRGSESGKSQTIKNYSVTYYRPSGDEQPVEWSDSEGRSGQIDYQGSHHPQPSYYPSWITSSSYTLTGTRIQERNYFDEERVQWIQPAYDWGYVDNASEQDGVGGGVNLFDISNAVTEAGASAGLKYIDFVKVQTACNTKSGWVGENSTEVFGIYDYSFTHN